MKIKANHDKKTAASCKTSLSQNHFLVQRSAISRLPPIFSQNEPACFQDAVLTCRAASGCAAHETAFHVNWLCGR
ncbi:MAG: hypothetical protein ACFNZS_01425 [Ottowia sp.]